jgi:hypothetical protein
METASVFWKRLLVGVATCMFAHTQPINSIDYKSYTLKRNDALVNLSVEFHIQMK